MMEQTMITLNQLREAAAPYGDVLDQSDADFANDMVCKGHVTTERVLNELAYCWAAETARVQWCEGQDAARHEEEYQ